MIGQMSRIISIGLRPMKTGKRLGVMKINRIENQNQVYGTKRAGNGGNVFRLGLTWAIGRSH